MACTQCVQSKKGCQYANNGQGRPPVNYPKKNAEKHRKTSSTKSRGRSRGRASANPDKEKGNALQQEEQKAPESERNNRTSPTLPRIKQKRCVEVVVPAVHKTKKS